MDSRPTTSLLVGALCALPLPLLACAADAPDDPAAAPRRASAAPFVVAPVDATAPLPSYDDAPRTPDADDPAIWRPSRPDQAPLVVATLKNAGLHVLDLDGHVVQTINPPNRPAIAATDPPAPGPQPDPATSPCPESASSETFGRFNNVAIAYGVRLRDAHGRRRRADLAIVSDRGCDRLRIYAIDPSRPGGPLVDVTAADAPRVFPARRVSPSPVQSPGAAPREEPNPLDDGDTVYGLAVHADDGDAQVVTSQAHRATLAVIDLEPTGDGRVRYHVRARLHLPTTFSLPAAPGQAAIDWTPCREEPEEDLQVEGLVVDPDDGRLYAAQEVVGVWAIEIDDELAGDIDVPADRLIERTRGFGAPYVAIPDDGEYRCASGPPPSPLPVGVRVGPGRADAGGAHLVADVEGLALVPRRHAPALLVVSSQGDDSFQVFERPGDTCDDGGLRHLAAFRVAGVGETDGLDVVARDLGGAFTGGLVVVQSGDAPPPASTEPVGGYAYDGASQLVLVRWADVLAGLP